MALRKRFTDIEEGITVGHSYQGWDAHRIGLNNIWKPTSVQNYIKQDKKTGKTEN